MINLRRAMRTCKLLVVQGAKAKVVEVKPYDRKLEILRPGHLQFGQDGSEQDITEKTNAEKAPPTRVSIPSNTIFIGQKPIMSYVTAIVMQFNSGSKELTVKARGRVISQAVDVVEVCRRRFFAGTLDIKEIKIGTEVLGEEGQPRNVSTIEIKLAKKD